MATEVTDGLRFGSGSIRDKAGGLGVLVGLDSRSGDGSSSSGGPAGGGGSSGECRRGGRPSGSPSEGGVGSGGGGGARASGPVIRESASPLYAPIAWLRQAQAVAPIDVVLYAVGFLLVAYGLVMGLFRLFWNFFPSLAFIGMGMALLTITAVCRSNGLLAHMSSTIQDFFVRTTLFDVLHDDSALTNFVRRWGRMLLLCYEPSVGQIRHLLEGLDPAFVMAVFHKPLVYYMPQTLQRILLPDYLLEASRPAPADSAENAEGPNTSLSSADLPRIGRRLRGLRGAAPEPLTESITQMLREKDEEKKKKLTEPEFASAALRYMALGVLGDSWAVGAWQRVRLVMAFALTSWGAAVAVLRSPEAQVAICSWIPTLCGLLGGFSVRGRSLVATDTTLAWRAGRNFSTLLTGMGIAGALFVTTLSSYLDIEEPQVSASNPRGLTTGLGLFSFRAREDGTARQSEPEREESPAHSAVAPEEDFAEDRRQAVNIE